MIFRLPKFLDRFLGESCNEVHQVFDHCGKKILWITLRSRLYAPSFIQKYVWWVKTNNGIVFCNLTLYLYSVCFYKKKAKWLSRQITSCKVIIAFRLKHEAAVRISAKDSAPKRVLCHLFYQMINSALLLCYKSFTDFEIY